MKNMTLATNLFIPDITLYIKGRDKVCEIVLNACKDMARDKSQLISLNTKLFKELNFSISEIISVILETGKILRVKFSYTLILQQNDSFSVEELGGQLWKYMTTTIKYN